MRDLVPTNVPHNAYSNSDIRARQGSDIDFCSYDCFFEDGEKTLRFCALLCSIFLTKIYSESLSSKMFHYMNLGKNVVIKMSTNSLRHGM